MKMREWKDLDLNISWNSSASQSLTLTVRPLIVGDHSHLPNQPAPTSHSTVVFWSVCYQFKQLSILIYSSNDQVKHIMYLVK